MTYLGHPDILRANPDGPKLSRHPILRNEASDIDWVLGALAGLLMAGLMVLVLNSGGPA